MSQETEAPGFAEWCVVELMGHQRTGALVRQADFPAGHVRLDIPATIGREPMTQIVNPQAIYRLTPTTKEVATAAAGQGRTEPVQRWELPALESGPPDDEDVSCGCLPSEEISTYGPF